MKLLLNKDNVIIDIAEDITEVEQGYFCNNCIYPYTIDNFSVVEVVEVPTEVKPGKYMYENREFKLNPNYTEPINPEMEIKGLKEKINLLQQALDDLILNGGAV
ncbi:hypothetical protein [Caloramator sp. Dgby_cultured_2]|uniref:hypothetical protein n=1 Tax=Caloramator sp. Dgby_cultured_2 TaxID=3029174 RepID=UPI00237D6B8E|nr:hypothetical protein [Caloramator sp. Dgby_cultured_2]WDU82257.1 hypothetical protein PWK10_11160 [Caloramator sp. Dgby_cultured_2]